jgi:mRNA-degrading endonuclease RelE of RelBE toxin-antitoxin system
MWSGIETRHAAMSHGIIGPCHAAQAVARDGFAMFQIEFTPEAIDDLRLLRKFDQQQIVAAIETQLSHEPTQETRNRKRLRPNQLAEWELRVGAFRVFYDVDEDNEEVKIEAIGHKQGSILFIHGEEYEL